MLRKSIGISAAVFLLVFTSSGAFGAKVESINFGYSETYPTMTNAIRFSNNLTYGWWSANVKRYNVEDATGIPYSYHDGYVETIGGTHTAAQAAARWRSILTGGGDSWIPNGGGAASIIGTPTIILLDEVGTGFKDSEQGPALKSALQQFIALGGTRSQIVILASPGLSMGSGVVAANYSNVIYCANNYCRWFVLELYTTQNGFLTGYDPDSPTVYRGVGDAYLASRLTFGIRNWTTTMGVSATRVMPMIQVCSVADQGQSNFYKYMNRQFWFMANGWYNAAHSGSDANIKTALKNGIGSWTWTPGTGQYELPTSNTTRDTYFEKYLAWYSAGQNTTMHSDGVTPPP